MLRTVCTMLVALQAMAQSSVKDQGASTFSVTSKENSKVIEISNVGYEVTGSGIPGRPPQEQLVLRKSTRTKQTVGEIGVDASTTIEAWPLGTELRKKPIYSIKVDGIDPSTVHGEVISILRGLEDTEWWSVYGLGSGRRLFDTYTPLVSFSISREILKRRYVGLEVPPDDTKDPRLKEPHVVAVLTYASGEGVIREALLTSDDVKQAQLLRSYADSSRILEPVEQDVVVRSLRITIRQNFPSPPNPVTVIVPLAGDDLDLAKAQTPARLRVAAFKR